MQADPIFRFNVASTSIAALGYAPSTQVLEVTFRRGTVYRYLQVPYFIVMAFLLAPSKGTYFNSCVRNCFQHQRV